jgi:ribonuclease Y
MDIYILVPLVLLACGISFFIGWFLNQKSGQNKLASATEQAAKIIADGEKAAETLKREKLLEVKDEWYSK